MRDSRRWDWEYPSQCSRQLSIDLRKPSSGHMEPVPSFLKEASNGCVSGRLTDSLITMKSRTSITAERVKLSPVMAGVHPGCFISGNSRTQPKYLSPCHSYRSPGWSSRPLAVAWPSPHLSNHPGSGQQTEDASLSLPLCYSVFHTKHIFLKLVSENFQK